MIEIDPVIATVLRLGLAALLLSSAWHKLRDAGAFRAALAGYALVPAALVTPVALLLMTAELVIGLGLLLPQSRGAAYGSAALMAVYSAAIAINLGRGRTRIDCGCGGPAGALPLSAALVARNVLLMGLSLCAALPVTSRPLAAADAIVIAAATLSFAFLYAAAETALANSARWRAHATLRDRQELASI